jgi:hypothetical protein
MDANSQNTRVNTSGSASESGREESHQVFHHLAAPKATAYRAILRLFIAAKQRFEIALRPSEIVARLNGVADRHFDGTEEDEVSACLASLCEWGNLSATRDVVSARTIEEYLHPKYLYQLTHGGDMAERALAFFDEGLLRPGELSALALRDITETLDELRRLLEADGFDEAKAVRAMGDLTARFETLVTRAQLFIGGLQRELDRPAAEESAFLALKEELLSYLERFVRELVAATYRISNSLRALEVKGVEPLRNWPKYYRPQRLCARARSKSGRIAGRGCVGGSSAEQIIPRKPRACAHVRWLRFPHCWSGCGGCTTCGRTARIARPTFSRSRAGLRRRRVRMRCTACGARLSR